MRKLILILLMAVAIGGYSQSVVWPNFTQSLTTYTMDGDTTYTFNTSGEYYFDFQFVWASLDQTDGSVKIKIGTDATNYNAYPNTDSLLFSSAGGSGIIRDTFKGTAGGKLTINVDSGTCSSGTLKIYGYMRKKQ